MKVIHAFKTFTIPMTSSEFPKKVKVSFEIPAVLDKQINDIVEKMGYTDRAEFIRAAIREKIESWKKEHPSHGVNDLK